VIALRAPRRKDIHRIVRLADEVFGDGYLSADDVNSRYLVLNIDGTLAGFVNTDIWDEEDATDNVTGFALGLIETIVIRPNYRGFGLGSVLVSSAASTLIAEKVDLIECYATTWSDSGICYVHRALTNNGFEVGTHYPRMWVNDVQGFICRACKKAPCLCDATLYRREVNTTRRTEQCQNETT